MPLDLSTLTKPAAKPPLLTLTGSPGSGKTSLAALFPAPIYVQAEEVSGVFDTWEEDAKPTLFPPLPRARLNDKGELAVSTKAALLEQLKALATQDHSFQTLVIDSITSLHGLFEHEVAASYGVDNVADAAGGFHKGYIVVKEYHSEVKAACDFLRTRKNMAVVFLAHTGIQKIKNRPDAEEYAVYSLDMHKDSIPVYTNLVDAVIYIRQEEYIKGAETDRKTGRQTKLGKISQTGNRMLITSGDGRIGYVNAKNRFDLDAEIPLPRGENPLLGLIPFYNSSK